MAIGLATFFPSSEGAVPCGASAMATVGSQLLVEGQQHRLGTGDGSEHGQHEVRQAVAVPIEGGHHQGLVAPASVSRPA